MRHTSLVVFRSMGIRSGALVAILAIGVAAASLVVPMTVYAGDTGVRGTVLWGPTKPGPTNLDENEEAALKTAFTVYSGEAKVAHFKSDHAGVFEVSLPPGEYTIVPDPNTPIPFPKSQTTQVSVPADGYAEVTIRLDTGMR